MAEEIILKVEIFEDDKKLFEITNVEELDIKTLELTIAKLKAELDKKMED